MIFLVFKINCAEKIDLKSKTYKINFRILDGVSRAIASRKKHWCLISNQQLIFFQVKSVILIGNFHMNCWCCSFELMMQLHNFIVYFVHWKNILFYYWRIIHFFDKFNLVCFVPVTSWDYWNIMKIVVIFIKFSIV